MPLNQITHKGGSQLCNGGNTALGESQVCFGLSPKCHKPDQTNPLHSKFLVPICFWCLFCLQHWSKFNEVRKQSQQSHICYSHSSAKMARLGAPKSHHWAGQSCVSASQVAGSVFPEHHDSQGSNSCGGPSDGDSPSGDFLIISNDPMSKKHFYHTEVSYLMYFYQNHKIFYLLPFLWRPHSLTYN